MYARGGDLIAIWGVLGIVAGVIVEGFKSLDEGQSVSFTEATGQNGKQQATSVRVL